MKQMVKEGINYDALSIGSVIIKNDFEARLQTGEGKGEIGAIGSFIKSECCRKLT